MSGAVTPGDLAVVIPTRDRWPVLRRTLDALAAQSVSGFETIVVVDGSDQHVPAGLDARVIVKEHGGPGAARNAGVAATARPLVLFFGDDMIAVPQLIERHLAGHERDPAPQGGVLGHVGWHPDVRHHRIARWLDWSGTQFDYRNIDGDDAGWGRFYSCNLSLKRAFFLDAGGFDEEFVYYYEDLDLGWRLGERGLRLHYERGARAEHLHRYDWPALERRMAGIASGERLMQAKHPAFEPFFRDRVFRASTDRRVGPWWPRVVDALPPGPLRDRARARADRWYYRHLTPAFETAWEGARGVEELRAYLGADFDESRLRGHRHAVDDEERAAPDESTFYKTSTAYLYDLTAFAMWPTKTPYLNDLRRVVAPGARLLDYGCGIGSDGLRLIESGYRVAFADFDNPSTRYLKWRLERRGVDTPVYDIEGDVPGGFDAVYAFDVIEHVDDPWAFLERLEGLAAVVAVNLLEPDPDDTHLHKPLPIAAIIRRAKKRGIRRYRKYHGRSHLVIYRGRGDATNA